MNSEVFESWLKKCAEIVKIKAAWRPAVIVMDNAPYHSRMLQKPPTSSSNKQELLEFMYENKIPIPAKSTNKDLLQTIKNYIYGRENEFKIYAAEQICKEAGVEILRLPPYHCELNGIEYVWGNLKHYVRKNAKTGDKIEEIERATKIVLDNMPREKVNSFIEHARKREIEFMEREPIQELIEPFIIPIEDLDSDEDDEVLKAILEKDEEDRAVQALLNSDRLFFSTEAEEELYDE
jgi:hypothetical protein